MRRMLSSKTVVLNVQLYSIGTQVIHSGARYSYDVSCKFYNMAIISKEIRWDATTTQKAVTSIRLASARTVLRCREGYLVSKCVHPLRDESGCQPRSLWRGTLIGLRIHLRLGLAHYRSDWCRDGKLEGGYTTVAQ